MRKNSGENACSTMSGLQFKVDLMAHFERAGPIGRIDFFVYGARWRNEPSGTAPSRAKADVPWHARSRLGCGRLDASLAGGVLIGLRNEAKR